MQIKGLNHVGVRVMDFERAIRFYEMLGFRMTRKDLIERVVVLRHDASGIEINLLDNGNNDNGQRNVLMDVETKFPGYTHYAITVDSAADAKTFLEASGVTITQGPVTFGDGKTSVFVRDPDRNVIEFTQYPNA